MIRTIRYAINGTKKEDSREESMPKFHIVKYIQMQQKNIKKKILKSQSVNTDTEW